MKAIFKGVDNPARLCRLGHWYKVGDVAGAPEPVRARLEQAFAENYARAAQRLAGSATTNALTQMIEKLERLLAEAGLRDIGNVEQFIQDLVARRSSLQEHVERRWHVDQRGPKREAIELAQGKCGARLGYTAAGLVTRSSNARWPMRPIRARSSSSSASRVNAFRSAPTHDEPHV